MTLENQRQQDFGIEKVSRIRIRICKSTHSSAFLKIKRNSPISKLQIHNNLFDNFQDRNAIEIERRKRLSFFRGYLVIASIAMQREVSCSERDIALLRGRKMCAEGEGNYRQFPC